MNRTDLLYLIRDVDHGEQRDDQIGELAVNLENVRKLTAAIAREVFRLTAEEKAWLDDRRGFTFRTPPSED